MYEGTILLTDRTVITVAIVRFIQFHLILLFSPLHAIYSGALGREARAAERHG